MIKAYLNKNILLKTVLYRIFAITSALIITYMFGVSFLKSLSLTITINIIHTVIFFIHEYIWSKGSK